MRKDGPIGAPLASVFGNEIAIKFAMILTPSPKGCSYPQNISLQSLDLLQKVDTKVKSLTIGRLAKQVGVNLETVRYYERQSLLPRPPRSASGYRLFPTGAARRLRFIRRAQELGFSLKEIRELLSLRVSRGTTNADIRARA
jgi:hypothetical protein